MGKSIRKLTGKGGKKTKQETGKDDLNIRRKSRTKGTRQKNTVMQGLLTGGK